MTSSGAQRARVVAAFGATLVARDADGETVRCKAKSRALRPITGDIVTLGDDGTGRPVVVAIEPRRNAFPRVDRSGRRVDLVANVDQVIVVAAPEPAPSPDLLNKYLVACQAIRIPAALFLNKSDLLAAENRAPWEATLELYDSIGYAVGQGSAKSPEGLDQLSKLIDGGTSALVGQSGVGKSSIVSCLVPDAQLDTATLSAATGKGRHTTTTARLYDVPGGGRLVDSPGVWEYGLWDLTERDIADGFVEFKEFATECRFNDCRHVHEPDCAVQAAAKAGEIHNTRYASYVRLVS